MPLDSSNPELVQTQSADAILTSVREFIFTQFPAARSRNLGDDDSLLTHGVVDSLGILEIITFIEKEFQVTVTDDELLSDRFETISRISGLVAEKTAEKEPTWTS